MQYVLFVRGIKHVPEIWATWRAFSGAAAAIFDALADAVITAVLRRRIIALAILPLDAAAASPRAFAVSSPFTPLTVNRLEISARNALAPVTPFIDAAWCAVGPRHVLSVTLLMMIPQWCGAPQSPTHCLAGNRPSPQFTSILKRISSVIALQNREVRETGLNYQEKISPIVYWLFLIS